jgi:DNA-binding transcriptional LysR family regulator
MDRLESMRVFVAVVAAGSFSGAARQLRMPVPTVSRKIAELEKHVRAKLLLRTTRKLALTEAGQSYVAACKRILEDVAEAERGASDEYGSPRGELVVTAPIVFGRLHVIPVIAEFLHAYAEIDVRLVLTDRALDLIGDRLDLAVRVGDLPDSRLIAVRVGQVRSVVCASPAYFKAHGLPTTPADLATHQCVTFATLFVPETWVFRAGRREKSTRVRSRLVVNTAEAAVDAAVAGVGVTRVLSYQVADLIKARKLVVALRAFEPDPVPVNLVYPGEPPLPRKLRVFLDFATPRFRARLSAGARG